LGYALEGGHGLRVCAGGGGLYKESNTQTHRQREEHEERPPALDARGDAEEARTSAKLQRQIHHVPVPPPCVLRCHTAVPCTHAVASAVRTRRRRAADRLSEVSVGQKGWSPAVAIRPPPADTRSTQSEGGEQTLCKFLPSAEHRGSRTAVAQHVQTVGDELVAVVGWAIHLSLVQRARAAQRLVVAGEAILRAVGVPQLLCQQKVQPEIPAVGKSTYHNTPRPSTRRVMQRVSVQAEHTSGKDTKVRPTATPLRQPRRVGGG
jgi:hypothetical protein